MISLRVVIVVWLALALGLTLRRRGRAREICSSSFLPLRRELTAALPRKLTTFVLEGVARVRRSVAVVLVTVVTLATGSTHLIGPLMVREKASSLAADRRSV